RGTVQVATIGEHQVLVVPTWHPAYVLRGNMAAKSTLTADLVAAKTAIEQQEIQTHYAALNDPQALIAWTDSILEAYEAGEFEYIACDVETSDNLASGDPRP